MTKRPNYRLHFRVNYRDDSLNGDHYFYHGGSDDFARKLAADFISNIDKKEEEEIKNGKSRQYDGGYYTLLYLKKINYVMREVIEEMTVSLEDKIKD